MTTDAKDLPTYTDIAADLAARIRAGEYPAGSRLPPFPVLAEKYGVKRDTVKRAMPLLRATGLVEYVPGRGTWVADRLPDHPA